MGFLSRLTGWEQQGLANNAIVAGHLIEAADERTKDIIARRIIAIQREVKGRYAGSADDILADIDSQPRSVQMNFVALACSSLGLPAAGRGMHFDEVENPYRAKQDDTLERIDGVARFYSSRTGLSLSWPGENARVSFSSWIR